MDLTLRDKMKVDCLNFAISQGLSEDDMITLFKSAAAYVQEHSAEEITKSAGLLGNVGLGALGLLAAGPVVASWASSVFGHRAGQAYKNLEIGQLPSADDIKLTDEAALYERNAEEILQRIADRKKKEKLLSKPSVRRMF